MGGRQWEVERHITQGGAKGSEAHAVGHMHRCMSGPQMEGPICYTGELRWRGRREEGKLCSPGGEVVVWGGWRCRGGSSNSSNSKRGGGRGGGGGLAAMINELRTAWLTFTSSNSGRRK